MDWIAFREGFWLVVQILAALTLASSFWMSLRKRETRQHGLLALGILVVLGLAVGLVKGLGVRVVTGG